MSEIYSSNDLERLCAMGAEAKATLVSASPVINPHHYGTNAWYDFQYSATLPYQMAPGSLPTNWTRGPVSEATPVNPASDTARDIGESWPKDTLHEAARQVIKGAKDLAPPARQAVTEAMGKASAAPTGREASDGALGRALGARMASYGLRTGQ